MNDILSDRIRERMNAMQTNATNTAVAAGLGKTAVRDILAGKTKSPTLDTLVKLAIALDCSVAFLTGDNIGQRTSVRPSRSGVDVQMEGVRSFLQAGTFRPQGGGEGFENEYPIYPHINFPDYRLELFRQADNTMTAIGLWNGDILTSAYPLDDRKIDLQDGMIVIAYRTLERPPLIEKSVRQVRMNKGLIILETRPLSSAPEEIVLPDPTEKSALRNVYIDHEGSGVSIEGRLIRIHRDIN